MKKVLNVLLLLATACITLFTVGCGKKDFNTLKEIKKNGKLVVSTSAGFPPFEYRDPNDGIVGFDIALINAYAESIDVKVVIKDMDFDGALTAVSTGKVDVAIAGITKNETREENMGFSDTYFHASQYVVVKEDSPITGTTVDEVRASLTANSARIGVQSGTTGYYYATGDADWGYDAIASTTCTDYEEGSQAIRSLMNGQLDCVIIDELPAKEFIENNNGLKIINVCLTEEDYAIATHKKNTTLIESLNEFIALIKSNGEFDRIMAETMAN